MREIKINMENLPRLAKALEATEGYCPCRFPKNRQNLCICEEVMNGGKCICGLFTVSEEETNEDN